MKTLTLTLLLLAAALVAWLAIEFDATHRELTEYKQREFMREMAE